jgi:hypothetical protein
LFCLKTSDDSFDEDGSNAIGIELHCPGESLPAGSGVKTPENGRGTSSNTVIISAGGILSVPARTDHNRKNTATGYDHPTIFQQL